MTVINTHLAYRPDIDGIRANALLASAPTVWPGQPAVSFWSKHGPQLTRHSYLALGSSAPMGLLAEFAYFFSELSTHP